MPVPASRMRGPATLPAAIASRSASVDAALVAEVAHGREARVERLARVGQRLVGEVRVALRQRFHQPFLAGAVAFEMHVAVDQAGQHVALAQIDDRRAGKAVGVRRNRRESLRSGRCG